MKKLGIIQPGKIGDIIICLPIAKWYYDRGYEIIWPIDKTIINNFVDYVDYVKFIPIEFNCQVAHQVCFDNNCNMIIDLAFTIPMANNYNSQNYLAQDQYTFDEFKYFIANVPFEEKWNLQIKRIIEREDKLKEFLYINDPYVIVQEKASDYVRKVEWTNDDVRRVDITKAGKSVFDWIGVLEKSEQLILIESCFSNLVDQLGIQVPKHTLLLKNGYYSDELKNGRLRGEPVLRLNWNRI